MLLIHPPIAKPSEPPAGVAQLAGALLANNHNCVVADLNLEGMLYLLEHSRGSDDTWTRRARKNKVRNLESIQARGLYTNRSRYQKTVLELNRLLETAGATTATVSLVNYQDTELSPLKSNDLLLMAEQPERSVFYAFFMARMAELFEEHSPDHIGISLNYLSQALNSFSLLGCIKKLAPQVKIIAGGGLITSWMRSPLWNAPFSGLIDACIDGCGEKPLLKILGQSNSLPALPRYDLLSTADYFSPGFILPYSSSTGCYWNSCSFCPERAEGNVFSQKDVRNIHSDIQSLHKQHSPILLHFLDNAIPPVILSHLLDHPPGLPWYGFARITHHLLDEAFCQQLKNSGCAMLKLGVETGSQRVLERLEKGLDVTATAKALQNLHHAGISTYVYLLFGTPAESYEDALQTLEFTCRYHKEISFLNLAIFNMPINSEERENLQTSRFYDGDLSLYTDFQHPQGWNRKEVRSFLDQQFKKQPEIAAILQHDPPLFTSNHAPLFTPGMRWSS